MVYFSKICTGAIMVDVRSPEEDEFEEDNYEVPNDPVPPDEEEEENNEGGEE